MSTLSRKNEIAKRLQNAPSPEQEEQVKLQTEQIEKTNMELEAKAKSKEAETLKQVADIATLMIQNPGLASMIDTLMGTIERNQVSKEESMEKEEGNKDINSNMIPQESPRPQLGMV